MTQEKTVEFKKNILDESIKVESGSFVKERYMKCPKQCHCKWKMSNTPREGYEYLNGACYLSGSFNLRCPE